MTALIKTHKNNLSKALSNFVLVSVTSLFPAWAKASDQTQTEEVLGILEFMKAAHNELDGMTVTLTGGLGTIFGDQLYFQHELGRFTVQFDAGREARRKIEGCSITLFGNIDSRCVFEVDAELRASSSYKLSDGGEMELIIYAVR